MSNSVFPESMNRIDPQDSETSITVMAEYIRYMCEKVDFALVNLSRKTGTTAGDLEERVIEAEMDITSLEGDVARVSGLVNQKLDKSAVEDTFSTTSENPLQNKTVTTKFNSVDGSFSSIDNQLTVIDRQITGITENLQTKVRGKPFEFEFTGACSANTDIVIGTSEVVFNVADVLSVTLKNITDGTIYDSTGKIYITNTGDVVYHTGTAITNPTIKGIVFY